MFLDVTFCDWCKKYKNQNKMENATMSNVQNVVLIMIIYHALPMETHVTLHSLGTGMVGNHLVTQGLIVVASA